MKNDCSKRLFGNERKYVEEVLAGEFKTSSGATMMRRLEAEFASRFGVKFAISFINGTATMHAALEAANVGPGDEVIVPPLTMSATTFAVLQCGATPVFADVDPDTFLIDATDIAKKISPATKAIITVALYGLSPDMNAIMELARRNGIFVVEDNAECFLGSYEGRLAGTLGDCASFSFQSSKHLTSGEGGMVITNDEALANKIRQIQSLGYAGVSATKSKITKLDIQDPTYNRHVSRGWTYRMRARCAVALAQVENIDALVEKRIFAAKAFEAEVNEDCDWLRPQVTPDNCTNSYWTWVCKLDLNKVSWNSFRDVFLKHGGDGIYGAWKLTYQEPMFTERNLLGREDNISEELWDSYEGSCPTAEYLQPRLLQFKTNYWDSSLLQRQCLALRKTIKEFS